MHIDDDEMRDLRRNVITCLSSLRLYVDDPGLQAEIERWMTVAGTSDAPMIDRRTIRNIYLLEAAG